MAKQACEVTEYKQAHILSTLAAGYAETGDFDNADHLVEKSRRARQATDSRISSTKELESYEAEKAVARSRSRPTCPEPMKPCSPTAGLTFGRRHRSSQSGENRAWIAQAAWELVCEYTASDSLRKHMLAVEAAMRAYARRFGEDEETWGIVGLLHDFDYERWPDPPDHPLQGAAILAERGYPARRDLRHQVARRLSDRLPACVARSTRRCMPATSWPASSRPCAKVRPEGIHGMKASSVKKKLKQKGFAAAVNRDDITRGAADLGVELDEHIQFVIDALAGKAAELDIERGAG